ncbi:MAG: hypothetical protein WC651_01115 [Candidatus Gracilibacteria bacterium]
MSDSPYFEQLEQNILGLLSEKKFKQAYEACVKVLDKIPGEPRFLKLKTKIEEAVEEENDKIIEKTIEDIKPLWDEKKYEAILKKLEPLLQVSKDNGKLNNLIVEAQGKYKEQIEQFKKDFEKNQRARLTKIFTESPERMIDELYFLETNNSSDEVTKKLVAEFRDKLIEKKIKDKKELTDSDKFDVIYRFIEELKKIDEKNPRIKELDDATKRRQNETQLENKGEFVYKGENYLSTLMKINKYSEAIRVAEEVLQTDPNNKGVKDILEEAKSKFYDTSRDETVDLLTKNQPSEKADYNANKENFTAI